MAKTETNDQAFPKDSKFNGYIGLTKREYFAGLAMQGLCSNPELTPKVVAEMAVKYADALINELNQHKQNKS